VTAHQRGTASPASRPMSKFTVCAILLAVWLLLWGSLSVANVLSGIAVAVSLFVIYPSQLPRWPVRRLHPWGVAVLVGRFVLDVVVSTFWLVVAALAPSSKVRAALVWVDLQFDDPALITMITNMTALTPGSMVVRIAHHDDGRPTVQLHCLAVGDPERFARSIAGLEVRCVKAIGTRSQRAALMPVAEDFGICEGPEDPREREALP
jgi:multicomponent Na+:H+ antiporter subunit E